MLNWTKKEVKKILGDEFKKLLCDFRQLYSLENNIPERFLLGDWMNELADKFVNEQLENFFKSDFMFVGDGIYTSAWEFVNINYKYKNFVDVRSSMEEEFVLLLTNVSPYSLVSRSYWYEKVRSVPSLSELGKYKNSSLEYFVMSYAEDWKEYIEK